MMTAEELLQQNQPLAALGALQAEVRSRPADVRLRVFLFQLLCVLGEWERALTQLDVLAQMDASTLAMVETYRDAVRCELLREDVFRGKRTPLVLGEPPAWIASMFEALWADAMDDYVAGARLRQGALQDAAAAAGEIDGAPFDWIADADARLGPVCEMVLNGKYYWVPVERISQLDLEAPSDLRDCVWLPVHVRLANGGETVGLIPSRYPRSEAGGDAVCLARKTVWDEVAPDTYQVRGQRMFATDRGEYGLLATRRIVLNAHAPA
jgi:type VI secretion system protein ImpE